jgi:hypothetical protein
MLGDGRYSAKPTPPVRAQADYDYLIKLLLIGDNGELAEPLIPFLSCCISIFTRSDLFGVMCLLGVIPRHFTRAVVTRR